MLFHTPAFLTFLLLTLTLYYVWPKGRLYILAAANAIFYGLAGPSLLLLFLGMSLLTYLAGLTAGRKYGRACLILVIILNALNLTVFKYAGFFYQGLAALAGLELPGADAALAKILLPIGISFYTFMLIAYLADLLQGKVQPCRSWLAFWVFIGLFPHLVAGPIMRAGELIPQVLETPARRFSYDEFRSGAYLVLWGLLKKMALADSISPLVDRLFADPALAGSGAWLAAYLFAFQIYFDFSAYGDLAVGIGRLMGFRLNQNFATPYVSRNPAEFWRRWNITLSNWIRDYVYIPLGGSRRGKLRRYLNTFLAMGFSGLWHGAAWHFVVWGLYHGALGFFSQALAPLFRSWRHPAWNALRQQVYFHLVVVGWVFFRAESLGRAEQLLREMMRWPRFQEAGPLFLLVPLLFLLHHLEYLARRDGARSIDYWCRMPAFLRGACYVAVIFFLTFFLKGEASTFIYFKF